MSKAHDKITDFILSSIDEAGEWKPCWHGMTSGRPENYVSGHRYRGSNILTCWVSAMIHGFASQRWASYKQWQAHDCQVRKGETGTPIIFYNVRENEETGEERAFARLTYVFNAEQVDGLPPPPEVPLLDEAQRIERCEQWLAARRHAFTLEHSDEGRAYYSVTKDSVTMPHFGVFHKPEYYYSVLAHELTHWTGADKRLARGFFGKSKEDYAKEELVAELGAAFIAAELGVDHATRDDHTAYLANWLKALKNDKSLIVTAASQASKAVDYLDGLAAEERKAA